MMIQVKYKRLADFPEWAWCCEATRLKAHEDPTIYLIDTDAIRTAKMTCFDCGDEQTVHYAVLPGDPGRCVIIELCDLDEGAGAEGSVAA